VPLTYEVSEWSLSSVRAWWELPRVVAGSYLGQNLDGHADPRRARCCHTVLSSPLSTSSQSHRRMPACTVCSWSHKWSGSRRTQSTVADIPKCDTLKHSREKKHVNSELKNDLDTWSSSAYVRKLIFLFIWLFTIVCRYSDWISIVIWTIPIYHKWRIFFYQDTWLPHRRPWRWWLASSTRESWGRSPEPFSWSSIRCASAWSP